MICTSIASIGRFETLTAQSELCRDGIGGESSGGGSNNDVTDGYTRKVGECTDRGREEEEVKMIRGRAVPGVGKWCLLPDQ